jgi:two-component system, OmpR family, sensor kinase
MTAAMTTRPFSSARGRILASIVVVLAFSTIASILIVRQVLLVRLNDRVEAALVQESQEFRRLVRSRDPRSGERFGTDIRAIFDSYLDRNVPGENEALLTFLGDRPYKSSARESYPLDELRGRYAGWTSLTEGRQSSFDTSAGPARALAVPIVIGGHNRGTFVVLDFLRGEREEYEEAVRILAAVNLSLLLLASLLAWVVAGRVLAPLRELRRTAQSITETDLTRRIQVDGRDELADLARTFNDMLDRLEAAFASQRAFVNDASHELRTPITIVRGHLELMSDDPRDRRETIELVMDELNRMSRIVDDLLTLAKSDRADFLDPGPVALDLLADSVLERASALADRDWELGSTTEDVIVADRRRLEQALINLARNAAEHTEPGATIAIGSELRDGHARIWVADGGPGVASHDHERIFERFARGADSGRRSDGAGLGLAIARAIAEAHGGHVELDSQPGDGATFTVVVPR